MIRLVLPNKKYKKSFLRALYELERANEKRDDLNLKKISKDFAGFTKKLRNRAKGLFLPKGYVPDSIFWLVDGENFIGQVSVRHKLIPPLKREGGHIGYWIRPSKRRKGYGYKILKLALSKAHKLGINKVLVTCKEDNKGSKKIIENNRGVFENKIKLQSGKNELRYWIKIS